MNTATPLNRRILVIDDNPMIIEDYRKVLSGPATLHATHASREDLFDDHVSLPASVSFLVDYVSQGPEGYDRVRRAVESGRPYAVAFVDMRMPPGWNGVETIEHIWSVDPDIQIVICTAFSDDAWDDIIPRLGRRDQLLILRKPFDPIEVQQLATSLSYKWHWAMYARCRMETLEQLADQRMAKLQETNVQLERDVLRRQMVETTLAETVGDLKVRNDELSQTRDQLLVEVHERERAEHALRQKTDELARSNFELDQFASVAAHDLQEPIHTIQVFSDLLRIKCADSLSESGLEFLQRILHASGRMRRLIQDLLVYSRLQSQDQTYEMVDLNAVVAEVLEDFAARIEETHATINVDALPMFDTDRMQMRQLLQNFIGNALKFHRPDVPPVVSISAHMRLDRRRSRGGIAGWLCQLMIEDNGIGIAPEHCEQVFGMFKRLHRRDEFDGTGIGLAVCKKIVERLGGQITVQSEVGCGSQFLVTLPVTIQVETGGVAGGHRQAEAALAHSGE